VRVTAAGLALVAALGWALDRLGALANPLTGVEDFAIAHPQLVVVALAVLAGAAWLTEARTVRTPVVGDVAA
jgi:hypothetical protein